MDSEDICGICGDDYSCEIKYTLNCSPCNHSFHYNCLIDTFLHTKYSNTCPYCRQHVGYLETPENRTPINKINGEDFPKYKCIATLKSGKNKGNECGACVQPSYLYCKRHVK